MEEAALHTLAIEADKLAKEVALLPEARRRLSRTERIWHYRTYQGGEAMQSIDWRQTARGDKILVRHTEDIKTHPVFLWKTPVWQENEEETRATLLLMALAQMLVKAERTVGWVGPHLRKSTTAGLVRDILCESIAAERAVSPPNVPELHASLLVFAAPFTETTPDWDKSLALYAAQGNRGVLLNLSAEESGATLAQATHLGWPIVKAGLSRDLPQILLHLFEESLHGSI